MEVRAILINLFYTFYESFKTKSKCEVFVNFQEFGTTFGSYFKMLKSIVKNRLVINI